MSKIFLGGSRSIGVLDPAVTERLSNLVANKHTVLIGDADGADAAMQSFLALNGKYHEVEVFCMGRRCRNNVGMWHVRHIEADAALSGAAYFAVKDEQMSREADFGFMVWDGRSKGTLNNVVNLVAQSKLVLVYCEISREFVKIKSRQEAVQFIQLRSPRLADLFNMKINFKIQQAFR